MPRPKRSSGVKREAHMIMNSGEGTGEQRQKSAMTAVPKWEFSDTVAWRRIGTKGGGGCVTR
jgi:hypothetical protein